MTCLITIHDFHDTDGSLEKAELTTVAEIEGDADDYTIDYDEQSDELKGCHTVMRVINGKCVDVSRTGRYTTNLKIEQSKRNICCYSTPMGTLSMGVCASRISSDFRNGRLYKLDFSYTLDFDSALVSKNRIKITASYKEEN